MEMKNSNRSGRKLHKLAALSLNARASMIQLSITLTIVAASIFEPQQAGGQILEWATFYNGIPTSALEEVEGVAVDASGNVFVTGLSGNGTGSAICTMRVAPSGTIQWTLL